MTLGQLDVHYYGHIIYMDVHINYKKDFFLRFKFFLKTPFLKENAKMSPSFMRSERKKKFR